MTEVVFVHERYPFGGGETVTALLAKGLTDADSDVHVTVIAAHLDRKQAADTAGVTHMQAPLTADSIVARLGGIGPEGVLIVPVDPPRGLLESVRSQLPGWKTVFILHSEPMWQVRGKTALSPVKAMRERLFKAYTRRYTRRYREIYAQVDRFCVLCESYRTRLAEITGDDSKIIAMYNPVAIPSGSTQCHSGSSTSELQKIFDIKSMKNKKIAFVLPSYIGGGAERVTDTVATALNATGECQVTIMVWRHDDKMVSKARECGLDIELLPGFEGENDTSAFRTPQMTEHIARKLRDGGFDAVVMSMVPLVDLDIIRNMAPECKIMFHHHGHPMYEAKDKLFIKTVNASAPLAAWRRLREKILHKYRKQYLEYYRYLYGSVDKFIVLCESYRTELEKIVGATPQDSHVVAMYNPVEVEGIGTGTVTKPASEGTVLYMGRLDRIQKRIERLLTAWAEVWPQHTGWHLNIVGDGSDRKRLEALAEELGITDSVTFCGYTTDPAAYYSEASIMALTSEYEGWPCMLLEGMEAGVVPVAMDCCEGVHEMLSDGRGILTPAGDTDAFARGLSRIMGDPGLRERMRPALKEFASRFTPSAVASKWLSLINDLTAESYDK